MNRLDEQVLAWGRSSADGEVHLKQPVPVPGTYTVLVLARGYEPLVGDQELPLDAATPAVLRSVGRRPDSGPLGDPRTSLQHE